MVLRAPHLVSGVYALSLAALILSRYVTPLPLSIFMNIRNTDGYDYRVGTHEGVCTLPAPSSILLACSCWSFFAFNRNGWTGWQWVASS
jgi:hypothetical protein